MKIKGLMAGIVLAILIMTTIAAAEVPLSTSFFTLYGQVSDAGVPVSGATVSLTINGVTQTAVTAPNGNYLFELANFPNVIAGTSMSLTATSGLKFASSTVKRAAVEPQRADLALGTSGIKLVVDAPAKSTVPDVYAIYILTITNPGQETEEYNLAIENPNTNVQASLSTFGVTIEAGHSENVLLYVMSNKAGNYPVGVSVSYLTEKKTVSTTTTVYSAGGRISGSGTIPSASFSITGQYPDAQGLAQGNVTYTDNAANLLIESLQINIVGTTVDKMKSTSDKRKGVITGYARVNGGGVYYFEVYVEDNGGPGKDKFSISLPTYPFSKGPIVLSTGNIHISK